MYFPIMINYRLYTRFVWCDFLYGYVCVCACACETVIVIVERGAPAVFKDYAIALT